MPRIRTRSLLSLASAGLILSVSIGFIWLSDNGLPTDSNALSSTLVKTDVIGPINAIITHQVCNPSGFPLKIVCEYQKTGIVAQARESARIRYPKNMRINQSAQIELEYSLEYPSDIQPVGGADKEVTISGAGLVVEPNETRFIGRQKRVIWSVRAENTGPHNLILNTANLFQLPHPFLSASNGGETEVFDASHGDYSLPIRVYTIWNIPDWGAKLVTWAVSLLAFILTIPFLQDLFWKKVSPEFEKESG